MDVAIVHYNTPELTEAAIRSVWKHTPGCRITVFDNSDKREFRYKDDVAVIDNTRGQIIDFEMMLSKQVLPGLLRCGKELCGAPQLAVLAI